MFSNYLICKRWDKFAGVLLAEHKIVQGCVVGGGGGAGRAGDNKEIKRITEEGRNNRTNRLREWAEIRQGPGK